MDYVELMGNQVVVAKMAFLAYQALQGHLESKELAIRMEFPDFQGRLANRVIPDKEEK